jgi:hypothetical protein
MDADLINFTSLSLDELLVTLETLSVLLDVTTLSLALDGFAFVTFVTLEDIIQALFIAGAGKK